MLGIHASMPASAWSQYKKMLLCPYKSRFSGLRSAYLHTVLEVNNGTVTVSAIETASTRQDRGTLEPKIATEFLQLPFLRLPSASFNRHDCSFQLFELEKGFLTVF